MITDYIETWVLSLKDYGIPPGNGSMMRVHFLRQDMEYPVASNAMVSAVPLPAYVRQNSI